MNRYQRFTNFVRGNGVSVLFVLVSLAFFAVMVISFSLYSEVKDLRNQIGSIQRGPDTKIVLNDTTPITIKVSNYKGGYETTSTTLGELMRRPVDLTAPARHAWMDGKRVVGFNDYRHLLDWNNSGDVAKLKANQERDELVMTGLMRQWMPHMIETGEVTKRQRDTLYKLYPSMAN